MKNRDKMLMGAALLLVSATALPAETFTIDLLAEGCPTYFTYDDPHVSWTYNFDFGTSFTAIESATMLANGSMTASIFGNGDTPFAVYLFPTPGIPRAVSILAGRDTHPLPENFDVTRTWELNSAIRNMLLSGKGRMVVCIDTVVGWGPGAYGTVNLESLAFQVTGTPLPEPITALALICGFPLIIRRKR